MSTESKDGRKHPRFSVQVEAVVHAPGGKRLTAQTRDVSRTGICLITSNPVNGGEELNLELVLSFGENAFSEPLKLPGRVVWCTPILGSFQVGAMFDELTEDQDNFLEMFLQFLDGTLAPRGIEEGADDEEPPPPPDLKDDPFR